MACAGKMRPRPGISPTARSRCPATAPAWFAGRRSSGRRPSAMPVLPVARSASDAPCRVPMTPRSRSCTALGCSTTRTGTTAKTPST
ncbi:hypothetical protein TCAP_00354 [Tolypocladium capitatum]|uniref:Uncharacterized protein n=1 Tax=Tolypocladium capitatum TaxID=45235 RepID=A0A2K3QQD6_9HYPO|nr:hypothetical protein TCAP_00354 [Tolypocladium capitatum]